jgi:peroxiredoxin Q/BCP
VSESGLRLIAGDSAPEISLLNQDSKTFTSKDHLAGKQAVLYFYPAAASPGCTKEASDFQDHLADFKAAGFEVIGISPDSPEKLRRFADAHDLEFELLSDPDLVAHKAFGAFGEKSLYGRLYRGVLRSTIVIDRAGKVLHALYNVKATGHVPMLRRLIGI